MWGGRKSTSTASNLFAVTDPREWTMAVLFSVAIGAVMAALSAPQWSYPVALAAFIAAIVLYQRRQRAHDDFR
jgi:1,4-dihydroxy-2-naphthoate octaprenyltransferase